MERGITKHRGSVGGDNIKPVTAQLTPMTQLHQIQAHLLSGQPIDKVTAYRLFGHTHVSSAISKLRKIGMEIHQRSTYQVNRMGKKVLCNEYFVKVKMEGREWEQKKGDR